PVAHRVEHLRADQQLAAHGRAPGFEPRADVALAPPAAVCVGGIEKIDAKLPGGVHNRKRLLLGLALAEEARRAADSAEVPAAQRDRRDLEAGATKVFVLHCVASDVIDLCVMRQSTTESTVLFTLETLQDFP